MAGQSQSPSTSIAATAIPVPGPSALTLGFTEATSSPARQAITYTIATAIAFNHRDRTSAMPPMLSAPLHPKRA